MNAYRDHTGRKRESLTKLHEVLCQVKGESTHIVTFFTTEFTVFAFETFPLVGKNHVANLGQLHAARMA